MNDTMSQLLRELSKPEAFDESTFQNFGNEMTNEMETDWKKRRQNTRNYDNNDQ